MLSVPQNKVHVAEGLRQAKVPVSETDEDDRFRLGRLFAKLIVLPMTIEVAAEILVQKGRLPAALKDDEAEIAIALWDVIEEVLGPL